MAYVNASAHFFDCIYMLPERKTKKARDSEDESCESTSDDAREGE